MSVNLQRIKSAPNKIKYTVFGWIRQNYHSSINSKSKLFNNIPELIYNICLCYYYIKDKWDKKLKSKHIILSNNDTCIYFKRGHEASWQTIFGEKICKTGITEWRLKIIKIDIDSGNLWNIIIGVVDCSSISTWSVVLDVGAKDFTDISNNYAFIGGAKIKYKYGQHWFDVLNPNNKQNIYGEKFANVNDEISVILDLNNYTISYKINGNDYGIAFNVEPQDYRLAISICKGRMIQLID